MATPFLKWAGGKSQLARRLEALFPQEMDGYVEPFLGGGSIFFKLQASGRLEGRRVVLADINAELINAYTMVRDRPEELIKKLSGHKKKHGKEYFYQVRAQTYRAGLSGAARTLYLNKTAFNGLYRVNSKGQFNVPMGDYRNPTIYDEANLLAVSAALQKVELKVQGFAQSLLETKRGDFVYLDPPYVPLSATSSFTGYIPGGFGPREQAQLARCLDDLDARGIPFVLSNSATETVESLYRKYRQLRLDATRNINCDASKRGPIEEIVVLNYEPALV